MAYLITGIAGFIGSHIAQELLRQGKQVIGLDNFSGGTLANIPDCDAHIRAGRLTVIEGDIRNPEDCQNACQKAEYVLHQAAFTSVPESIEKPHKYHLNNETGTLNMLAAARDAGVKRFVFASSTAVYGDSDILPVHEDLPPRPKSPYALNKLVGEQYCRLFFDLYGLKTVALRYFNVFGPRQSPESDYAAVIPKFITSFLQNQSPVIYGNGCQTRDFIYIRDVALANIRACQLPDISPVFGQAINIGSGRQTTIKMLAETIKTLTKSPVAVIYGDERTGDIVHSVADTTRTRHIIDVDKLPSLDDALEETIRWFASQLSDVSHSR